MSPSANNKQPALWTSNFSFLLVGALLQGLSFFFLMPVLPLYVEGSLDGTSTLIGVTVAVFSLTAVSTRPFSGYLLDRFGRRGWLLVGSVLFFLSMFRYLLTDTFASLLLIRLIHGLAWGMVGVAAATIAADLIPAGRLGEGMGFYGMSMPIAMSIGPVLGLLILNDVHFDNLFLSCGVIGLAACLCFFLVKNPPIRNRKTRLRLSMIIEKKVLRIFFFLLLVCTGYGGIVAFAPLYAPRFGLDGCGPIFSVYAAGVITSRIFGGRWYDRSGPVAACMTGLSLLTIGWLGTGLAETKLVLLISGYGLGLGFGLIMPSIQAMTVELVAADRRGAANATMFSAFDVGISSGALGFGLLAEFIDLSYIFLIAGGLSMTAMLVFLFVVYPHYRKNRITRGSTELL
ncbi:MAG: MFS transporter [Deltaproteobacteria bacterium]|nr:MFS transporter [Deltaproteobacteria bacterium]